MSEREKGEGRLGRDVKVNTEGSERERGNVCNRYSLGFVQLKDPRNDQTLCTITFRGFSGFSTREKFLFYNECDVTIHFL